MDALVDGLLHIPLTRGFVATVDAERFESTLLYRYRSGVVIELRPSAIRWAATLNRNYFYATHIPKGRPVVALHRLLAEPPAHLFVDHRNGDTMDNRLVNLRVCTAAENARNCRKYKRGSSRFKGVRKRLNRWVAQWHYWDDGRERCRSLGSFLTEEEAAMAYDAVAAKEFGEFARLNFPLHTASSP
jgi:hypothetical protein